MRCNWLLQTLIIKPISKHLKTARMASLRCMLLPITVLLVSATFTDASAQVFIKPEPSTECPSSPCHTISELLEQHEYYFTSDTTLHFLTGLSAGCGAAHTDGNRGQCGAVRWIVQFHVLQYHCTEHTQTKLCWVCIEMATKQ